MSEKDLVEEWIRKGDHDWGMAELALQHKPEYADSICFHCQQAVEKYLKAYLVFLGVRFEKKHNLIYLLDLINDEYEIDGEIYAMLEQLEDYAVEVRYPDERFDPTLDDAKNAFEIMVKTKNFILARLKGASESSEPKTPSTGEEDMAESI